MCPITFPENRNFLWLYEQTNKNVSDAGKVSRPPRLLENPLGLTCFALLHFLRMCFHHDWWVWWLIKTRNSRTHMNLLTVSTSRQVWIQLHQDCYISYPHLYFHLYFIFFPPKKWTMRNALAVYQMKPLTTGFVSLEYWSTWTFELWKLCSSLLQQKNTVESPITQQVRTC